MQALNRLAYLSDKNIATITATLRPARKKKCEQCLPTVKRGATPSPLFTLSKEKQNDDISYEHIGIERLFFQGEFNTLTERYGEHDNFYFQMFCDAWNTDEDYFWFERICIGRLMLMLPHPAHAVFLLQAPDPLVLWSENARTAAKHCGLIQQLLISAMKKERLFTAKPHSAIS